MPRLATSPVPPGITAAAAVAIALATGAGCDRGERSRATRAEPPRTAPSNEWFADLTAASGLDFVQRSGTNYTMPDQMGSGVVVFDYDGDGRLDLYCLQHGPAGNPAPNQLFHQEPDGRFRNVSAGSGLDLRGRGMSAAAGDLNNDGRPDLVVTEYGATRLLVNEGGGRFREITGPAALDNPRWGAAVSFLDYDRDGWLDVVVGNYLDYDPTQVCQDVQGRPDFCAPSAFGPTATRLWHNETGTAGGPPRFTEVTERSGLVRATGMALGLVCADFDGDGWADIFCADDGRPNRLFINRHDGTFREEAGIRGLALNAMGRTAANMGVTYADADGDGLGDVFVTHLSEEFHAFFRQDRRGWFTDAVAQAGLQRTAWRGTGFGAVMADFDADGAPDLAVVNGLVRRMLPAQSPCVPGTDPWWTRYAQRAQLFANEGGGRLRDISEANPAFCGLAQVGRALALGDLDGDGAPDLVVSVAGGPARIFRNIAPHRGHWVKLRLVEPAAGGRDAIGAEAVLEAGARRWWAVLQPATSYFSSHEPALHFGVGAATTVDRFTVRWPDGTRESFPGGAANQALTLAHGKGEALRE